MIPSFSVLSIVGSKSPKDSHARLLMPIFPRLKAKAYEKLGPATIGVDNFLFSRAERRLLRRPLVCVLLNQGEG
jgi:hypothetical protein